MADTELCSLKAHRGLLLSSSQEAINLFLQHLKTIQASTQGALVLTSPETSQFLPWIGNKLSNVPNSPHFSSPDRNGGV